MGVTIVKDTFYKIPKEKQDRIIQSAVDEFAKHGYDISSIQNIIKKSEIPRGSFYQYFKDKEGIYYLIIKMITVEKMNFLKELMPMQDSMGVFDFLKVFHRKGIEWARNNPKFTKIGLDFHICKTLNKENLVKI